MATSRQDRVRSWRCKRDANEWALPNSCNSTYFNRLEHDPHTAQITFGITSATDFLAALAKACTNQQCHGGRLGS